MTQVWPLKKREREIRIRTSTHTKGTASEDREKPAISKLRREVSEEVSSEDTLISNL